ncbi:MAG: hypothetical protein QMC36_04345 [Patescibacteria group bacterium]
MVKAPKSLLPGADDNLERPEQAQADPGKTKRRTSIRVAREVLSAVEKLTGTV